MLWYSQELTNIDFDSSIVCPLDVNKNDSDEAKIILQKYNELEDYNNPCVLFINECMNNLNMYFDFYEKKSNIFHTLVI